MTHEGFKSDLWAVGVTLYFLIFKRYPFTAATIPALYAHILNHEPDYTPSAAKTDPPPPLSFSLLSLLHSLLEKDPRKRITLAEVIAHDWVTANGLYPLEIPHRYNQIEIGAGESEGAIGKVKMIEMIKLKLRRKIKN